MKKLLIYNPNPSSRLSYTFELLLKQIIGISQIEETTSLPLFLQNEAVAKLNYSTKPLKEIPSIVPHPFMQQTNLQDFKPIFKKHHYLPAAFFCLSANACLPFDVFALCFYLVSRYEEYSDSPRDLHQRFTAHQSLAYQHHFLGLPLVNIWALALKKILKKDFPSLEFQTTPFRYTPSYDIDYAFAFLQKGWLRQTGAFLRNLKNLDIESLNLQLKTSLRRQKDPYFVFDYLQELDKKYQLSPLYFWLLGDHGRYDKNIKHTKPLFRQLISENAAHFRQGIHPSYQSNTAIDILQKEIKRLQQITHKNIIRSRQHYLKINLPTTYQRLIKCGIQEDYSMGYAQELGFRASIATPFYWFDLHQNKKTNLLIYPFQVMDVTLNNYLQLSPNEAIEKVKPILAQSKAVNGHFISIWHNSSLCEAWNWKGWRTVYETIIENSQV